MNKSVNIKDPPPSIKYIAYLVYLIFFYLLSIYEASS